MFTFNYISQESVEDIADKISHLEDMAEDEALIIPFVHPSSKAGKLLTDDSRNQHLSAYAGSKVHLLYFYSNQIEEYSQLIININNQFNIKLPDPCVLVYIGQKENGFVFTKFPDDDELEFKRYLQSIIDACLSPNPERSLKIQLFKDQVDLKKLAEILKMLIP